MTDEHSDQLVSNSEFLRELAQGADNGTSLWITSFIGTPDLTDAQNWTGKQYKPHIMSAWIDRLTDQNTYFSVAALKPDNGTVSRRKANFSRLLALVVDDVQLEDIQGQVSYILATSPGKHQVGILIDRHDPDAANATLVDRLINDMASKGMLRVDPSGNNSVRYVRLPVGQNQKPRDSGVWAHRMLQWSPNVRYSLADAAAVFGVDLDTLHVAAATSTHEVSIGKQDELLRMLTANIVRGERIHDSLNEIAASLTATGMPGGSIVNLLRGLMEASHAPHDDRWLARYQDIPRSVSTAEEKYRRKIDFSPAPADSALPLLNLEQLQAAAASISWSVKHVIPSDSIGVLFGGSGTFKSFIAIDYALHIVHGLQWLGKKTKPGPVIFIAAEGGAGLWKRIAAWHQARGLNWHDKPLYVLPVAVSLADDSQRVVEAAMALGVHPQAIIVDTMSQTFSGEENSAAEVSNYLRCLGNSFRALWHCVVMVIHHSGHQSTERPRGSSAIRNNVDFMLGVHRDQKEMLATLEFHKQKDGELLPDVTFQLTSHQIGKDEDGEAITSLVARELNTAAELIQAMSQEKTAGRSGRNQLLLNLAQTGQKEKELRHLFYEELTGDPEMKKKAFYRARDWAVSHHFIEITQGTVLVLKP